MQLNPFKYGAFQVLFKLHVLCQLGSNSVYLDCVSSHVVQDRITNVIHTRILCIQCNEFMQWIQYGWGGMNAISAFATILYNSHLIYLAFDISKIQVWTACFNLVTMCTEERSSKILTY